MITKNDIQIFLNSHDYDIRKTKNSRWLDQKVTYDVSSIIAHCVQDYVRVNGNILFSATDIWHSDFSSENIIAIFNKPGLNQSKVKNEYDKFFSQPLLFLASAKVLQLTKKGNRNFYTVNNEQILDFIASRDYNAYVFTEMYIEKVMRDSNLWDSFEDFFNYQTKDYYYSLKETFGNFLRKYTPINGDLEPNRIFAKVLNPLAVSRKKLGTKGGYLSKNIISLTDLQYNQPNFRDLHSKKPKEISRTEWSKELRKTTNSAKTTYQVQKSKDFLRDFNNKFRNGQSEISDSWSVGEATQIHHIFPAAEYLEISDVLENLVALTPTQHFTKAHPKNNTQRIDSEYQKLLLLSKLELIEENINQDIEPIIYSFESFVHVLSVGFDEELEVNDEDFSTLRYKIIEHYN